jgi:serine phosphatase RsbU (regulator of sigma subunit)
VPSVPRTPAPEEAVTAAPLRVLLVEDDDGDAILVEDLLEETAATVVLQHVRTLAEAVAAAHDHDCALLDLDLPDASGIEALRALRSADDELAILVLTGLADERRGIEALAAGAQDYLVKGRVDGELLARSLRYAVERRRAEDAQRQLDLAQVQAAENARLERGLLPTPLVGDPHLRVAAHYRAGRRRALLGGDFYDVVEDGDGAIHAIIGDVCGHGPDEAALGVAMRIAWRTLVLAGTPADEILPLLQDVLHAERHDTGVFTTLAAVTLAADRASLIVRSAGHPLPLLLARGSAPRPLAKRPSGPPLGIVDDMRWAPATVELPAGWGLLLYTDGAIEGRLGRGSERLGEAGLIDIVAEARERHPDDPGAVVRTVVEAAEQLNEGPLLDDTAVVMLTSDAT